MATKMSAATRINSAVARATSGARARSPMAIALFLVISCILHRQLQKRFAIPLARLNGVDHFYAIFQRGHLFGAIPPDRFERTALRPTHVQLQMSFSN